MAEMASSASWKSVERCSEGAMSLLMKIVGDGELRNIPIAPSSGQSPTTTGILIPCRLISLGIGYRRWPDGKPLGVLAFEEFLRRTLLRFEAMDC